MGALRRVVRFLGVILLALVVLAVSGVLANEIVGGLGRTSRVYSFMHRVQIEQDGYGTEYEIGRLYIVHHSRLIRPLGEVRFTIGWEHEPTTLVRSGRPVGDPTGAIASMMNDRYLDVPADIRAAWAASIDSMVRAALRDGPDAALTGVNQDRDTTTLSYPIPGLGVTIPEEIFRRGRVVVYPPGLRIDGGNPLGFLILWLVVAGILAVITKLVATVIRQRASVAKAGP